MAVIDAAAGWRAAAQGHEMSDLITYYTLRPILHPPVLFIKSTEGHVFNMNVCMQHNKQTDMVIISQAKLILRL